MGAKSSFGDQLSRGFGSYVTAFGMLFAQGMWKYLLFPLLLLILLFLGGYALTEKLASLIRDGLFSWLGLNEGSSGWLAFLSGFMQVVLGILLKLALYFVFSSVARFLVLIVFSPVMALISEQTEELITGKKYPFNLSLLVKNSIRGMLIAFRSMIIQLLVAVGCFLLCFIPVLGWISPLIMLLSGYYFFGFSLMDYVFERRELNVEQSVRSARDEKVLAITLGFVFSVIFAIPYIGILLAPVVAPIAACVAMVPQKNK